MAGPIAVAYVEIRAKIDQNFSREVTGEVDEAMRDAEKEADRAFAQIDRTIKKTGAQASAIFKGIDRNASKAFDHMSAEGRRATDQILDEITRLRAESARAIELDINADTSEARKDIRRLEENLRVLVRGVDIPVDVDTDAAERGIVSLFAKVKAGADKSTIKTFGELNFSLAKVAATATAALAAIVPVGPALVGVAAGAVAVGGALGLASGALLAAGAAATALVGAFAAVKIGSAGVSDALKAQSAAQAELAATGEVSVATQEKLDAAMRRLSPSARNLVTTIGELGKVWSEVRRATQEALFSKSSDALERLSQKFLPSVRAALVGAAGDLNGFAQGFVKSATSAKGVETVNKILFGMRENLKSIVPAIGNIVGGLATLLAGSQKSANGLSQGFLAATERFVAFTQRITEDGSFQRFLDQATNAAGVVGRVFVNLGKVLTTVFGAGAGAGVAILDNLAKNLQAVQDSLRDTGGQEALAGFFGTIQVLGKAVRDVIGAIGPVLGGLGASLTTLAGPVDRVRAALLPLVTSLGEKIGGLLQKAQPGIKIIGDLVASVAEELAPALDKLLTALEPIAGAFIEGFIGGLKFLAPVLKIAAKGLGFLITALAKVITFASPILEFIANFIGGSAAFGAVGKAFSLVGKALGKVGPVVKSVGKFLSGLVKSVGSLGKAFAKIPGLVGKGLGKLGSVVKKALATVGNLIKTGITKYVQFYVALPGRIFTALGKLGSFIGKAFTAAFNFVSGLIRTGITKYVQFYAALPGRIFTALAKLGAFIGRAFTTAFNFVSGIVRTATANLLKFFTDLPGRIVKGLGNLGGKVGGVFTKMFNSVRSTVRNGVDDIVGFFTGLPGKIKSVGTSMFNAGKNIIKRLIDGIKAIGSGATGIAASIGKAVQSVINGALAKVNSILEFTIDVPDVLPGPSEYKIDPPDLGPISLFAKGGIVDRATLGILGEAGREVVVPLERGRQAALDLLDQSGLTQLVEQRFIQGNAPELADLTQTVNQRILRTLDIPEFATGGIVDKATLALIGEAGREVVVPLERGAAAALRLLDASGLSDLVESRLTASLAQADLRPVARTVARATQGSTGPSISKARSFFDNRSDQVNSTRTETRTNAPTKQVVNNIEQNFNLVATTDPAQQAGQIAARLAAIMQR